VRSTPEQAGAIDAHISEKTGSAHNAILRISRQFNVAEELVLRMKVRQLNTTPDTHNNDFLQALRKWLRVEKRNTKHNGDRRTGGYWNTESDKLRLQIYLITNSMDYSSMGAVIGSIKNINEVSKKPKLNSNHS